MKAVQGVHALQHSENYDIYFRCAILYTHKTMQNYRKHPSIQNHRHNKTRKCDINMKLYLGYYRNRLEGG